MATEAREAGPRETSPSRPSATEKHTRIDGKGRNWQRLGYRRIVQLLVYLVIIPTVLLLAIGIILMFVGASFNLLFGILTVSFVAVMVTGVVLVLVFIRREANLSELQADFVSKVSHELRTPLTSIRLFVETMERTKEDPEAQEECRKHLLEESERLTSLIERLLDWGRMEAGRKVYDLRIEEGRTIVDGVVKAFAPQRYQSEGLEFVLDVQGELPRVQADKAAVVDALLNLLSNARKYGGTPPKITLRAYASDAGDLCIEVGDNGAGIPHGEHSRIFQKFYRIDDRLSRAREGSGLGLAIVKHIARAHGATISLHSEKGEGSKFTLVLPPLPKDAATGAEEIALDQATRL